MVPLPGNHHHNHALLNQYMLFKEELFIQAPEPVMSTFADKNSVLTLDITKINQLLIPSLCALYLSTSLSKKKCPSPNFIMRIYSYHQGNIFHKETTMITGSHSDTKS